MGLKQEYHQFKQLLNQGGDLLFLRLRLLRLDANEQIRAILWIIAAIVIAAVCALIGFVALLFGLNVVLSEETKMWVFLGGSALMLLLSLGFLLAIPRVWQRGSQPMNQTLQAMQQDWRLLRGESSSDSPDNQYNQYQRYNKEL